jgi:hypothetical protein
MQGKPFHRIAIFLFASQKTGGETYAMVMGKFGRAEVRWEL